MSRLRIAVLWQRFGPYHLARLAGLIRAARTLEWDALGIEVASRDEYAWSTSGAQHSWRTLFPQRDYRDIPYRELKRALESVLEIESVDAVCVNGWSVPEAVIARKWGVRRRLPVVLMSETHRASGNWVKEWVKGLRVRQCHGAVVGGAWHRDYLLRLGMPGSRIRIGYDAVDNDHFSKQAFRRPESGSTIFDEPYFFANTRFLARKGIVFLLKAYQLYRQACRVSAVQPWNLVISGSGEEEQPWKKLADDLDVGASVYWPGFVQYEQLPAWYQNAGAFVHVATSEAWGLVINEACAAGLPIIAGSKVGATCELVEAGVNGWLLDPKDIGNLAKVLMDAATMDSEKRRDMGLNSRAKVANLGPDRFGNSICELLSLPTGDGQQ